MNEDLLRDNRELAHVRALAENPHMSLGLAALSLGFDSLAESAYKTANKAGISAGKDYVAELSALLEYQEAKMLVEEKTVKATYDQFRHHRFMVRGQPSKVVPTRAWNALAHGAGTFEKYGMDEVLIYGDEKRSNLAHGVVAINLSEEVLGVLPELVECGKTSQAFIEDFYRKTLAEQEQTTEE